MRKALVHLCICGAYGQGKSHTLAYIQAQALEQGYVVSTVNLDAREVPLHQFRHTYRALLQGLILPPQDSVTPGLVPGHVAGLGQDTAT